MNYLRQKPIPSSNNTPKNSNLTEQMNLQSCLTVLTSLNQFTHKILGQFKLFTNVKEKGKIYNRDMSKRKRLKSVKTRISDNDRESSKSSSSGKNIG